jgi:hypothetical protein
MLEGRDDVGTSPPQLWESLLKEKNDATTLNIMTLGKTTNGINNA